MHNQRDNAHMTMGTVSKLNKRIRGFTLIEMLITIAIVGILAAVAIPSYNKSKRKTRRTDAASAMLQIQVAQEKFRGSCKFYAQNLGSADACGTTAALSTVKAPSTSDAQYYTLALSGASGNAYVITATATGDQASDTGCTSMTLTFNATNPKGLKGPTGCWAK